MRDLPSRPSTSSRLIGGAFAALLALLAALTALLAGLLLQGCLLGNSGIDPATPAGGNGYFQFATPGAGQGVDMDSSFTVNWTAVAAVQSDSQRMDLYTGSRFLATLDVYPPGAGGFSWLPAASIPATNYLLGTGIPLRFKITSVKDSAKWDFGPAFALVSNYSGRISIASPTAQSDVRMNSAFTIRWNASGNIGSAVGIQLFKDTAWAATLALAPTANGNALWSPVQSSFGLGSGYRIRVFSRNNPGITVLSPAFSITSLFAGAFTVLSPGAGDTLQSSSGKIATVKWTSSGNVGNSVTVSLLRDSAQILNFGTSAVSDDSLIWAPSMGLPTSSHYRIKMASLSDSTLVAYSKEFTVKGMDRDWYEPDDSLRAADSIGTDGSGQLRNLTLADEDWIRFSATKTKKYLLSLRVTTATASFPDSFQVYFVDSAGSPRNFGVGSNIRMILTPAYSGTYFARVKCPRGYGSYALSVNAYDTAVAPYYVPFQAPNAKTPWPAGSINTIAYTPDSTYFGTQVTLGLYNDTTLIQTISPQAPNSGTFYWNLPAGLLTSNRYRIRIANYFLPSIFAFSDNFSINGVAPDSFESDNSQATAKDLAADGIAQTHSITLNDTDWVRFNAAAGKSYLFTINGSATTNAYVTDSAGTLITFNSGSKFYLTVSPPRPGKYFARVQYNGGTGNYALSLNEFDSAKGTAPVKFQAPTDSTAWNSGSAYALAWTPDTVLFGSYVGLALYADSILVRTLATTTANNGVYSALLPTDLYTSTRYRIRMMSGTNSLLYAYSPYFTVNGMTRDAFEPDNGRATAKDIATNGVPQARTLTTLDTDWVQFNATAGKSYLVTVNGNAAIYAFVLDSAGIQYSSATGTKFSQIFAPLRSGKYFVRAQYYGGYTAYNLSVNEFATGTAAATAKFQAPTDSTAWNSGGAYALAWTPDTALFGTYVS